jgi:hypothetical protein
MAPHHIKFFTVFLTKSPSNPAFNARLKKATLHVDHHTIERFESLANGMFAIAPYKLRSS